MKAIENMIEMETVQNVMEDVVDNVPTTGTMNGAVKNGLAALAVVGIWEAGKWVVGKTVKFVEAKKAAKNEAEDFADQEAAEEVETK